MIVTVFTNSQGVIIDSLITDETPEWKTIIDFIKEFHPDDYVERWNDIRLGVTCIKNVVYLKK